MIDARRGPVARVLGVHAERLEPAMVKDRDHDVATAGERLAYLDLLVVPVEAAAELEDSARQRRATGVEQGALTQLAVDVLGVRSLRYEAGDEERRHLRRCFGAAG